ncbi:hypothetical protein ABPG72_001054, partial [Tetrahymena utriculariae]
AALKNRTLQLWGMSPHWNHPNGDKKFYINLRDSHPLCIHSPLYYSQLNLQNNYYDVSLHYFLSLSINPQYINISICYLLNRQRKFVYEEVQILGIHLVRIKTTYQINTYDHSRTSTSQE